MKSNRVSKNIVLQEKLIHDATYGRSALNRNRYLNVYRFWRQHVISVLTSPKIAWAKLYVAAIRSTLVILCSFILYWLFVSIYPSLIGDNFDSIQVGSGINPHLIFPLSPTDNPKIILSINDLTPDDHQASYVETRQLIYYVQIPQEMKLHDQYVCIESLHFRVNSYIYPILSSNPLEINDPYNYSGLWANYQFDNLCTDDKTKSGIFPNTDTKNSVMTDTIRFHAIPQYFFPFDRGTVTIDYWLNGRLKNSNPTDSRLVITPDVDAYIHASEWNMTATTTKNYSEKIGHEVTSLYIDFQRPRFYQILTVAVLGSVVILIITLLFIKDISNLVQIAIGILLGLWGVQNIIIPPYITGAVIIIPLILLLYISLAFVLFIRFFVYPIWNKAGRL
jgi:hypothetical protein